MPKIVRKTRVPITITIGSAAPKIATFLYFFDLIPNTKQIPTAMAKGIVRSSVSNPKTGVKIAAISASFC